LKKRLARGDKFINPFIQYDIAYERSNSFADRNKADHIILEQRAWDKVQIERFWFKRKSCNLGCDSSAELGEGG